MVFIWTKKFRVAPAPPVQQDVTVVTLPTYDKISPIEHKNGKSLVGARKKDDEAHEVKGDVQEGGRSEEGHRGSKEELSWSDEE